MHTLPTHRLPRTVFLTALAVHLDGLFRRTDTPARQANHAATPGDCAAAMSHFPSHIVSAVMVSALLFFIPSAEASNIWDGGGGDNNWNTAANWDTDAVPIFPQALTFNGTTRLTSNNDLSGLTVNGFTFGTTAGSFTITGNAITLGGNITFAANPGSAVTETINLDMALSANRTVTTQSNGTIVLGGVISGANTLTKTNTGTLTLNGTASTFTGGISVTGGTLKFASIGNVGVNSSLGSNGTISSNGGALEYIGSTNQSSDRSIAAQGSTTIRTGGTGNLTLSNVSAHAANYTNLSVDAATGTKLEISSNISGNTASLTGYTKVGKTGSGGTLVLSGTNTFTGGLSINAAAVEFSSDANLGATPTGKLIGLVRTATGSGYGTNATVSLSFTGDGAGAAGNTTSNAAGALNQATPTAQGSGYTYAPAVVVGGPGTGGAYYAILEGQITMAGSSAVLRPTAAVTVNRPIHMQFNSTFEVNYDSTFSGIITSEAGGNLVKTGSAVMSLGDSNRYTGTTTISNGTLSISSLVDGGSISGIGTSSSAAANLLINAGTLRYTGSATSSNRSFTIGNNGATIDASGTGVLALTSTSSPAFATADAARTLTLTGNNTGSNSLAALLANNGTGALNLVKLGLGSWTLSGNNSYTGGTTVGASGGADAGTLLVTGSSKIGTGAATVYGGTLDLSGFAAQTITTLNLGGGASGSTATVSIGTGTLTLGGTVTYTATNNPKGAAITGSGTINLVGDHTFAIGNSTAATNDLTISAIIANGDATARALTKNGAGTLLLTGNNTYTGLTTVDNGTLSLGHAGGTIADSANVTVSGGTLYVAESDTVGAVTISSGAISGSGTLIGSSYSVSGGDISAVLGGTAALTKSNSITTATLSGNNSYTGGTTTIGVLILGNKNALGTGALNFSGTLQASTDLSSGTGNALGNDVILKSAAIISGPQNITLVGNFTNSGGTWDLSSSLDSGKNLVLAGNVYMSENATTGRNLWISGTGNTTVSGVIANYNGAGAEGTLTITNTGTTTLTNNNTYTGETKIGATSGVNAGTVKLSGSAKISTNTTTVYGGTLDLADTTQTITLLKLGGGASGSAANVIIGSGGTLNLGGTVTYTETNNPNGATISGAGTLHLNGSRTFTVGNSTAAAADLTVSTAIANGSGTSNLTKTGTGTLLLSGANTYNGTTTVSAGTLSVANLGNATAANALGMSSNAAASLLLGNGTTLQYSGAGAASTDRLFTINGAAAGDAATLDASGTGAVNFTNNGALAYGTANQTRTLTLTGNNTGNNTLAAQISNNGNSATSLTKAGVGTWVLSGTNAYTGGTLLSAGTLAVNNAASLGNASGNLTFSGTSTLQLAASFDTSRNYVINSGVIATINTNSNNQTNSGTISGSGGLIKDASGTLTLTNTNTFTGTTTVSAGTLKADAAGALGGTTSIMVNTGGTLLISADHALSSATAITMNSTIAGNGTAAALKFSSTYNGTVGALTLAQNTIFDLGTDLGGVKIHFASITGLGNYTLSIYNWTGKTLWEGGIGDGIDQIYIGGDRLTSTQLQNISFYSGLDNSSFVGKGFQLPTGSSFASEVMPVPEPATWVAMAALALGGGLVVRRRRPHLPTGRAGSPNPPTI